MAEAQWTWMVLAMEDDHGHFLYRWRETPRVHEEEMSNDARDVSTWDEVER